MIVLWIKGFIAKVMIIFVIKTRKRKIKGNFCTPEGNRTPTEGTGILNSIH